MLWGLWVVLFSHLLLSGDKVPVVHQPGFELFRDFYLHFHTVGKHFLLDTRDYRAVGEERLCLNMFEMITIIKSLFFALVADMKWKQELGRGMVSPERKRIKGTGNESMQLLASPLGGEPKTHRPA